MDSQSAEDSGPCRNRARQALPPIRTLLGPELALPPLPSSHSSHSASSWSSARPFWDDTRQRTSSSSSGSRSGDSAHRAEARARSSTVSSRRLSPHPEFSDVYSPSQPSAHSLPPSPFGPRSSPSPPQEPANPFPPPSPYPPIPSSAPAYSYNVLRPSASGGLITAPSQVRRPRAHPAATRSHEHPTAGPSSSGDADDPSNTRRHVCPICHKRFNRPSSLRTHESVHTGERPFACPHPGCTKSFSVASNMRRHLRTHGYSEPEPDPEPESEGEEPIPLPRGPGGPGAGEGPSRYYEWAASESFEMD